MENDVVRASNAMVPILVRESEKSKRKWRLRALRLAAATARLASRRSPHHEHVREQDRHLFADRAGREFQTEPRSPARDSVPAVADTRPDQYVVGDKVRSDVTRIDDQRAPAGVHPHHPEDPVAAGPRRVTSATNPPDVRDEHAAVSVAGLLAVVAHGRPDDQ